MRFFVLFILLVTGCVRWTDLPEAPLRPVITAPFAVNATTDISALWAEQVHTVADVWNNALVEAGCAPIFRVVGADATEPAYPVTLYTREEWPGEEGRVGELRGGSVDSGRIDVVARAPFARNIPVLVHEFGHALGLDHDEHVLSAMNATVNDAFAAPTLRDVFRVCP